MARQKEITYRISVDVGEDLYNELQKHVPWGTMKHLVIAMLEDFLKLCDKHDSRIIIGAILSDEISLKDFINRMERKDEDG
jgi:hypothetical protein